MNAALRQRMEELSQAYEWLRQQSLRVHEEAAKIHGQAESPDGMVAVTVGSGGELLALTLDPRASRRVSIEDLAATVVDTVNKAVADASARRSALLAGILPGAASGQSGAPGRAAAPGKAAKTPAPDLTDPATWVPDRPLTDETVDEWLKTIRKREERR